MSKIAIFSIVLFIITLGCTQAEDISGKWAFIDSEDTVDESNYIRIDSQDNAYFEYQGNVSKGNIEEVNHGWIFYSDQGNYKLSIAESINEFDNGSLSISEINEYGDILIGYFKRIEE